MRKSIANSCYIEVILTRLAKTEKLEASWTRSFRYFTETKKEQYVDYQWSVSQQRHATRGNL